MEAVMDERPKYSTGFRLMLAGRIVTALGLLAATHGAKWIGLVPRAGALASESEHLRDRRGHRVLRLGRDETDRLPRVPSHTVAVIIGASAAYVGFVQLRRALRDLRAQ
jgi:hypothetical protein